MRKLSQALKGHAVSARKGRTHIFRCPSYAEQLTQNMQRTVRKQRVMVSPDRG